MGNEENRNPNNFYICINLIGKEMQNLIVTLKTKRPLNSFMTQNQYRISIFDYWDYFYYFKTENEYVCTNTDECPSTHSKKVVNKNKCIDSCSKDKIYKYQYSGECLEKCPDDMNVNEYKCEIKNIKES